MFQCPIEVYDNNCIRFVKHSARYKATVEARSNIIYYVRTENRKQCCVNNNNNSEVKYASSDHYII